MGNPILCFPVPTVPVVLKWLPLDPMGFRKPLEVFLGWAFAPLPWIMPLQLQWISLVLNPQLSGCKRSVLDSLATEQAQDIAANSAAISTPSWAWSLYPPASLTENVLPPAAPLHALNSTGPSVDWCWPIVNTPCFTVCSQHTEQGTHTR